MIKPIKEKIKIAPPIVAKNKVAMIVAVIHKSVLTIKSAVTIKIIQRASISHFSPCQEFS